MLTEQQLRLAPKKWRVFCNEIGWRRNGVPPEVSQARKKARERFRIDRSDNAKRIVKELKDQIARLKAENHTLRLNLRYAADEAAAAHAALLNVKKQAA
jgi:phage protein D